MHKLIVVIAVLIFWKRKPINLRDKRKPATSSSSPGVDFGEKNKFRVVQIEDITGCDLAED